MKKKNDLLAMISGMESGKDVSRRRLFRAIGSTALARMERDWRKEVQSRGYKPPEIAEYAKQLGVALRKYGKAEHHSCKGSAKARRLYQTTESNFENALEYLTEMLQSKPDLRFWIDRDINFNDVEFGYHPEGMPYPVWSKSPYARKNSMQKRTIRDFKREALHEALEKLERRAGRKPEPLPDLDTHTCSPSSLRLQGTNFSDWKF